MKDETPPTIRQPLWPRAVWWNVVVACYAVAVAACWAFIDLPFHLWVREQSTALRDVAQIYTKFGSSAWILIGSGVIVGAYEVLRRLRPMQVPQWLQRLRYLAAYIFVAVAVSGLAISLIKNTIGRARPKYFETLGPFHFEFAAFDASFAAFPSGHSTTFGATAAALTLLFPRAAIILLPLGLLGGLSRAAVGAHWLSDITAGLACGAIFALLLARYFANSGIVFALDDKAVWPRRR